MSNSEKQLAEIIEFPTKKKRGTLTPEQAREFGSRGGRLTKERRDADEHERVMRSVAPLYERALRARGSYHE